jgi:plasmid maintenance system antidote protein VapI
MQRFLVGATTVDTDRLDAVLHGHAPVTAELALRLGRALGNDPEFGCAFS